MEQIPLLLNHDTTKRIGTISLTEEGISLFSIQHNLGLGVGGIVLESEVKDDNIRLVKKIRIVEISVFATEFKMYKPEEYESAEVDPVKYAIMIIEWYQSEIRNLTLPEGTRFKVVNSQSQLYIDKEAEASEYVEEPTLSELGFCQGTIGTHAIARIKQLAGLK